MYHESVLRFGNNKHCVAIVCEPKTRAQQPTQDICVLMSNTGIGSRIGPYRFHVDLARQLAGQGITSVRYDVSGLGDSASQVSDKKANEQGVEDSRELMNTLCEKFSFEHFVFFGNCSAAFRAQATAEQDQRVLGIACFDGYYFPTPAFKLRRIVNLLFQKQRWLFFFLRIFLRKKIAKQGWNFGLPPASTAETAWPTREQSESQLLIASQRGLRQLHIFSEATDSGFNSADQFWEMYPSLQPYKDELIEVCYLKDTDHLLSLAQARKMIIFKVADWINCWFK